MVCGVESCRIEPILKYRSGEFPCTRCGHRSDMHEMVNKLALCRVCDYVATRLPCSMATLKDEAVLTSLRFDFKRPKLDDNP